MSFRSAIVRMTFFSNFRILTDTMSILLEPAQPMSCSVSNSFKVENKAEINNTSVSTLNATFELSAQDISLVSKNDFLKRFFVDSLSHEWAMKVSWWNCQWQGVALSHSWNRSSLFVTTMNEFDNETSSMLARNSTYSQGSEKYDASFMLHTACSIRYRAWDFEIREKTIPF